MKGKDNIEFDAMIRSILADAEEAVPERVWEGVSRRIADKRRHAGLWKWTGAIAAAAAAVAVAVTLPGQLREEQPVSVINNVVQELADVPAGNVPAEETPEACDNPSDPCPVGMTGYQSYRSSGLVADIPASPVVSAPEPDIIETESVAPESAAPESADRQSNGNVSGKEAGNKEAWSDPFARMDYEDAHKKAPVKVTLDVNGLVGTNDSAKPGNQGGAIRATASKGAGAHTVETLVEDGESTYGVPVSFGIGARISFGNRWSVGTGVNYSLLTRKFAGIYTPQDGKAVKADAISHNIQYIGIPVNVYYDMLSNDVVSLYTFAGGSIERAISNKYLIPVSGKNQTLKQDIDGLQMSAGLGLGVQFKITDKIGIYVDPSARYYFGGSQPKSIRTQQPFMFNLEAGLRFNL